MNTVVLTSVLSAGNHALFAGTRVLYGIQPALTLHVSSDPFLSRFVCDVTPTSTQDLFVDELSRHPYPCFAVNKQR